MQGSNPDQLDTDSLYAILGCFSAVLNELKLQK
jgi:hypothetical protein